MEVRKIVDKVLGTFVIIVMGVLVIDVLWQVASRYLVGHPSSFTDELASFLLIWVGLFGAAYVTGQKQHLAIDLLPRKLSPEKKKKLDRFINILICLFALIILVIGGTRLVYITLKLNQISSALQLPLGYVYIVLPISGLFIMFYTIHEIIFGVPEELENKY